MALLIEVKALLIAFTSVIITDWLY